MEEVMSEAGFEEATYTTQLVPMLACCGFADFGDEETLKEWTNITDDDFPAALSLCAS